MKELRVSAIKEGTVIDHIPSKKTFQVVKVLSLQKSDQTVMVAQNLKSKNLKEKGIVKVAGKALTTQEVNKIAVLAPHATVNIIKDYNVAKKVKLELPKELKNVLKCSNPKCITNHDKVQTRFIVKKTDPIIVKCAYCERAMTQKELEVL